MDEILLRFEYLINKNPLKAIHLIKKALAEQPTNFEYLVVLGAYLAKEEKDSDAIKYFERAKKIGKLDYNHIFVLALSYMRKKDYTLAIRNFKEVGEIYPEAIYNSAICYLNIGQADKAITEVMQLKDHDKLGQSAIKLIIDILLFTDKLQDNSPELSEYKKRFGEDVYYHYIVGNQSYAKGKYIESAYHLSKIPHTALDPDLYLRKLAHSYRIIKQYNKAFECYKQMESEGHSPSLFALPYAETLYNLGKYEEVIRVSDRYYDEVIDKAALRNIRAKAYYKLNLE